MSYEPKILLTIYKEGGTLVRKSPEEREFVLTKKDLSPNQKWKNGEGNKIVKKGKYTIVPFEQQIVTQKITMCEDAYEYMTSSDCPSWYKNVKEWRHKLTPEARLNLHLKRTCEHFNGIKFTYAIIED